MPMFESFLNTEIPEKNEQNYKKAEKKTAIKSENLLDN